MTTSYRKKLIEVALPLDAINKEAARENYIYRGNPSAIHKWWAQRPLAACRAVLFASLVDDPGNDQPEKEAEVERKRLFGIIEELVVWENSNDERVLHAARTEIARSVARAAGVSLPAGELSAEQVREVLEKHAPPVLDPFCGGGSIPLEAQRLGLKAYASDLNPVAVLITKALIEIPPKFAGRPPVHPREDMALGVREWKGAAGLAEDVRYYGKWMRDEAEKRIGHLYPKGPNGETVIAWLWARTVKCPNPACNTTAPLIRSFTLSSKKGKETWVEPTLDSETKCFTFTVRHITGQAPVSTVGRTGAICLACHGPIGFDYIRNEAQAGRMNEQLMATVTAGFKGRSYYSPTTHDHITAPIEESALHPQADLPKQALGFRVQRYGMTRYSDLFTQRQLAALACLCGLVQRVREEVRDAARIGKWGDSAAKEYSEAIATYLAFACDKYAMYGCSLVPWYAKEDRPSMLFTRQAIAMVWDFAEINPLTDIGGSFIKSVDIVANSIPSIINVQRGVVDQKDAVNSPLPADVVVSTDPPYYDNVAYADLSDFFYVWLRQSLQGDYPDLFKTLLVPKAHELIAEPFRHGGRKQAERHFLEGTRKVFVRLRSCAHSAYPLTIYYAFKQSEADVPDNQTDLIGIASTGWETMLEGLAQANLAVTGTWPMRTERSGRMRDRGSNALASSIVLVCRPRPSSAPVTTRREFISALKKELPSALTKLTHGGVAPVDLAQASIGPGMAVFSRYARVLEADGTPMGVRTALQIINQQLDEYLAAVEGDLDRDTRFAVAWFQQFGQADGPFGDADVLARAKDTAVQGLVQAGVLHSRGGKVRLLRRGELAADWDPRADARLTVWECTQQLIRRLNETGELGAAQLLKQLGAGRGEDARALAYRLYAICERKGWADEALAYNALVASWGEIEKRAAGMEGEVEQGRLL